MSITLWLYGSYFIPEDAVSAFTVTTDTVNNISQDEKTQGLKSLCAILAPALCNNGKILRINVLQNLFQVLFNNVGVYNSLGISLFCITRLNLIKVTFYVGVG